MNELIEVARALRSRINEHRSALSRSETLTRYALVDPLLRALGWSTDDPSIVVPEYPATGGRADYALLNDKGRPLVMVEAKKLGESLEKGEIQGIQYCLEKGTLYFVITDGQRWRVYETHKAVPVRDKLMISFDLGGSIADACRKALALWRPGVLDNLLEVAPPPLSTTKHESNKDPLSNAVTAQDVRSGISGERVEKPYGRPDVTKWLPLSEIIERIRSGAKISPQFVKLPDNSMKSVTYWWHILRESARWLHEHGSLTEESCPIQRPKSTKRYLVATKPVHPSGKEFVAGTRVGDLHVETHASALGILSNTKFVVLHVGSDPSSFHVGFRSLHS